MADDGLRCVVCRYPENDSVALTTCAKCSVVWYCCRECKTSDRKPHQKICTQLAANRARMLSQPYSAAASHQMTIEIANNARRGLSEPKDKPFHALQEQKYLHDRPQADVLRLLIDSYRLRMDDNFAKYFTKIRHNSPYARGTSHGYSGFRQYLSTAKTRQGLLPAWWSAAKQQACLSLSQEHGWTELRRTLRQEDVNIHYSNRDMALQLCMLAEQILEDAPLGKAEAVDVLQKRLDEENGLRVSEEEVGQLEEQATDENVGPQVVFYGPGDWDVL